MIKKVEEDGYIHIVEVSPRYHIFKCSCCDTKHVYYEEDSGDFTYFDSLEEFTLYNN